MAEIKCKLCGGSIQIIDQQLGECLNCGIKVLLPRVNEERIANLYARGNHFREVGEYDRAYAAFESIVAEDRDNAEAHWCLLLCRYGINYVKDKQTEEFAPTVSRMNRTLVMEDPDYQAAVRCSAGELREQYIREAKRIQHIQDRFLKVMMQEKPYDVFICFKAEEADGTRTEASRIGQNIYEELTANGLRVFFSRITLENKLGEEYEPYIFSALYTAKAMLVVADKPEQLTARWVKNEWSRYLALMDNDSSKAILPVFSKMSPYDFPPEIPTVQGQNMDQLGAMQNLTQNVLGLCGKKKEKINFITEPDKTANIKNTLKRIKILLESEEFEEASARLNEIFKQNPENGEAWYDQIFVQNKASGIDELLKKGWNWNETKEFKKARKYGDVSLQNKLDELEQGCGMEKNYQEALRKLEKNEYKTALELFENYSDYRDSREQIEFCKKQLNLAEQIALYHKEVGDRDEYADYQLKERYPNEYEKYAKLLKKERKVDSLPQCLDWGLKPMLAAVAMWGSIFWYMIQEGMAFTLESFENSSAVVGIMFLILGISISAGCLLDSFWAGVAGFVGSIVALSVLETVISETTFIVLIRMAMIGMTIFCVFSTIVSMRAKKIRKKVENYYLAVLEKRKQEVLQEVDRKWEPLIGEENLRR